MNNLVKVFRGMKTLLNKIETAKGPETKKKYQDKLKEQMEILLRKQRKANLLIQEKKERSRVKELERRLKISENRQRKLESERRKMDSKFKKLQKEKELRSRLMSQEEIDSMEHRLDNEPISNEELEDFTRKYNDHVNELLRRKKQMKKQRKEVRDPRRRRKLNDKFEYLNDVLKKTKVVRNEDRSTRNGQILVFDISTKGSNTFTVQDFLEIVKPSVLNIWQEHNDSSMTKLILSFVMVKYRLLGGQNEIADQYTGHISTSFMELFRGTDLNELYEHKKSDLNTKFAKRELNGSGWVLLKLLK